MKLVVDGVFFSLAQSGITRIWQAVLPRLVEQYAVDLLLLDRGGIPDLPGIAKLPFPSYTSKYNSYDSLLIEEVCKYYSGDVFVSTYYTTPLRCPSVSIVYDMIPERFNFDLVARDWREKELAIAHGRRHLCISQQTRRDLLDFYAELDPGAVDVAYCGIDPNVFMPTTAAAQEEFQRRLGLTRPFFLFVGSRTQHKGYKNSRLFFETLTTMVEVDFDILCLGGEKDVEPSVSELIPEGCRIIQSDISDHELVLAYGSAAALVYPSLYEGFGLPVIEAMACKCPVITTHRGSLPEVTGEAAYIIGGESVSEMAAALQAVRTPGLRTALQAKGLRQAAKFRWDSFTSILVNAASQVITQSKRGAFTEFYDRWSALRKLQGEVDADL